MTGALGPGQRVSPAAREEAMRRAPHTRAAPTKGESVVEYFFIMTLSWGDGRNVNVQTRSGIATADVGQSQESIYTGIFKGTCESFGAPQGAAAVTFYYLARNET